MSGLPYPEGVTEVIGLLDSISACEIELEQLGKRISEDTQRAKILKENKGIAWRQYTKLMDSMDVSAEGNYGFERRAAWFLAEMRRQTKKE